MSGRSRVAVFNLRDRLRASPSAPFYVLAFVLAARFFSLARLAPSSSGSAPSGDIAFYQAWAARIIGGELTDGRAFYALPLYAYWLAALQWLLGPGAFLPAFLQCCADAGTALLLYLITAKLIAERFGTGESGARRGRIAGVIAAVAWAFYLPAQAFSIVLMPTVLGDFVFWFLVWQIVGREKRPGWLLCLFWGLLIGVTAMAVATMLFVIPLLLAALWWKWGRPAGGAWARVTRDMALLVTGVALGTAPCWLHNYVVAKDPVFLSAHSGINFWIGNNPDATGYPHFGELRAGQTEMLSDSVALAEKATGRTLRRGEVSAYWSAKAKAYIASDFSGWLRLLGKKIWNFWNAFQYDDLSVISKLRDQGVIFPGIQFGLIATLALAGIPFVIRAWPRSRWILAAVGLQMVAILPVFITERYRLAAVPGLVVLAVLGLWQFWECCAFRRVGQAAIYLILLAIAAGLVSWSPAEPARWALDPYNTGREALDAHDLPLARRKLELAHGYVPGNAEINLALGNLWLEMGDRAKARAFYGAALAAQPEHKSALNNLSILALGEGDKVSARAYLERSLRADPASAKSHYLLAKTLLELGELERALMEVDIALSLSPQQPEFHTLREQIRAANPPPSDP